MAQSFLVRPPEPLVGRAADLAAILDRFADDQRLVTITGAGGAGKTRLAIEVGLALATGPRGEGAPRSGVWRAELGEARGVEGICDAAALALGLPGEPGGDDPVTRIGRALAARGEAALVLDEMEALVAHAPATVGRWLAIAPEAIFLVTSRERLGIPGEAVHALGPLPLPEGDAMETIAASEAVELFVRAVRRVRHDFALQPAEAPFVAALVRALDGLPLAIELAAPRMAVMGARALLHRMQQRFDVLRRGARGPSDRHAAIEAVIDASWAALTPHERDALAQCTVFRGGFSVEAAEAVIDLRAHAAPPSAIEAVASLRDKSLLDAYAPRAAPGETRLTMLASVREFAAQRLDPAAARAAEARHADHVVGAAEAWSKQIGGRGGPDLRARILLERDNLLAVIERVLGRGPVTARAAEPALRALLVLAPALLHEGPLEAYVRLLEPVLTATRDSGADPRLTGNALAVRGALLRQRGQGRAGSRDLVQALAIARTVGDPRLEARVTHELGHALAARGEIAAAEDHFDRALATYRAAGDRAAAGDVMRSRGALAARLGRLDEAAPLLERALATHRAERDPIAEAEGRLLLGELLLDAGKIDEARAHLAEATAIARDLPDRRGEALATGLRGLADHLADPGDRGAARAAYEAASATLGELGFAPLTARFTGLLGILCREEGRTAEAFTVLSAACDLLGDEADDALHGLLLAHCAGVDGDVGRAADARALIDQARAKLAGNAPGLAVVELEAAHVDRARAPSAIAAARAISGRSAMVRLSLKCLDRALGAAPEAPPPPDDALLVGPSGLWFRAPGGTRVPLDRRRPLALLLDRLAAERIARPGAPLGWEALLDAAWPGERVLPAAGVHRVRVAVSTLRKLGLKDVLRTSADGYLLAAEIAAIRV